MTAIMIALVVAATLFTAGMFNGDFRSDAGVTLLADRAGLAMEPGAKVKMRGVDVGQVSAISGTQPTGLQLEIDRDQIKYIPTNIGAEIRATTAFGAKFVDLVYPSDPSSERLRAGSVLHSTNTTTETNTVFENLVAVLNEVDPPKLNAVLTAVADAVRGKGSTMGQAIRSAAEVTTALNAHQDSVDQNFRSLKGFSDTYSSAAHDIIATLDAAATTSTTISTHAAQLDALLLSTIGFADAGINLLATNGRPLVTAIDLLAPTTSLLLKYNPEYTCLFTGAQWLGDHSSIGTGGNGYSTVLDATIGWATDPYRYPDNLPKVAATGGPGGQPSCGSLPDATKNYPVRALVTDTGWGTGLDRRPNPGIAHPWWVDFLPTTRAVPQPPSIRGVGSPAIGPVPYPGAPPYGAPLFNPDGTPLWAPPPPGAPPPPVPGTAVPAPPYAPPPTP
jgi:phospholipid/cholesterol/gamma-HCH transport system substrate-binding protein